MILVKKILIKIEENFNEENYVQNVFSFYIFDVSNDSSLYIAKKRCYV